MASFVTSNLSLVVFFYFVSRNLNRLFRVRCERVFCVCFCLNYVVGWYVLSDDRYVCHNRCNFVTRLFEIINGIHVCAHTGQPTMLNFVRIQIAQTMRSHFNEFRFSFLAWTIACCSAHRRNQLIPLNILKKYCWAFCLSLKSSRNFSAYFRLGLRASIVCSAAAVQ